MKSMKQMKQVKSVKPAKTVKTSVKPAKSVKSVKSAKTLKSAKSSNFAKDMYADKTWNSVIFIKTKSDWSNTKLIAKMPGVQNLWSVTGDWDWCIKLDPKHSSPEQTESFVKSLRKADWCTHTNTSWWKQESF